MQSRILKHKAYISHEYCLYNVVIFTMTLFSILFKLLCFAVLRVSVTEQIMRNFENPVNFIKLLPHRQNGMLPTLIYIFHVIASCTLILQTFT